MVVMLKIQFFWLWCSVIRYVANNTASLHVRLGGFKLKANQTIFFFENLRPIFYIKFPINIIQIYVFQTFPNFKQNELKCNHEEEKAILISPHSYK